jgi:hypothetical protein
MKVSNLKSMAAVGLGVLAAIAVSIAGCSLPAGGAGTGTEGVTFSFGTGASRAALPGGNLGAGGGAIAGLIVSVEKTDGTVVYDMKRLSLVNLSGAYVSEKLPLAVGQYRLTAFFVVDAADNALFATPLEGSPLADQVRDALPTEFGVQQGLVTALTPQVVSTDAQAPEKFGYLSFKFEIVGGSYPSLCIGRSYDPGPDGQCFTADDVMRGYYLKDFKRYGTTNMQKEVYNAGADGVWLTDDDVPSGWWWSRYDFGGSSQNNAGPDGIWFTADDVSYEWNNWEITGLPGIEVI